MGLVRLDDEGRKYMDFLSNEDLFYKIADFWFLISFFMMDMFAAMKDYIPTTRNRCRNNSKENRSSIL